MLQRWPVLRLSPVAESERPGWRLPSPPRRTGWQAALIRRGPSIDKVFVPKSCHSSISFFFFVRLDSFDETTSISLKVRKCGMSALCTASRFLQRSFQKTLSCHLCRHGSGYCSDEYCYSLFWVRCVLPFCHEPP